MANNCKAFVFHLILTALSFVFLVGFVATAPILGMYTTNTVSRIIIIIITIALYVYAGTLLDAAKDKRFDFFAGSIIALIGIGLWIFTVAKTGFNLSSTPEELGEYWILYNLYYGPFSMIYFLVNTTVVSPLLNIFTNLIPTFLLGCGLKYKRYRLKRN